MSVQPRDAPLRQLHDNPERWIERGPIFAAYWVHQFFLFAKTSDFAGLALCTPEIMLICCGFHPLTKLEYKKLLN
jgi:hypothetical protein